MRPMTALGAKRSLTPRNRTDRFLPHFSHQSWQSGPAAFGTSLKLAERQERGAQPPSTTVSIRLQHRRACMGEVGQR